MRFFQTQVAALKSNTGLESTSGAVDLPSKARGKARVVPMVNSSLASVWAVEITCLRSCFTAFEVADCLERIAIILMDFDSDTIMRYCRYELVEAVQSIQKLDGRWNQETAEILARINRQFFDKCCFQRLADPIIYEILCWLPIADLGALARVSTDWNRLACANHVWEKLYHTRFLVKNPVFKPRRDSSIKQQYRTRLRDPEVGDRVEVSWRGKFRLEGMDVYQGVAWWTAEIVDKNPELRKYKVHYPGWESRWDEWVDLHRLRWEVDRDMVTPIHVNQVVELWCTGVNVPGAWLEARVQRTRNGLYHLGRVLSSSRDVWVPRNRLRPVTKAVELARRMTSGPAGAGAATAVVAPPRALFCSPSNGCSVM